MLGYLPGLIHAWYIISVYPEVDGEYEPIGDAERGNATVHHIYVVSQGQGQQGQINRSYGTTGQGQGEAPKVPEGTRPGQQQAGAGEGSNGAARAPPTYAEAIKGDHKVQTRD